MPTGTAPPEDAPSPAEQQAQTDAATMQPAPSAATVCGFSLPTFTFNLGFSLPPLPSFNLPNLFNFSLALKCPLDEPTPEETQYGGGKVPTGAPQAELIDY
jgi:hypothetical protein